MNRSEESRNGVNIIKIRGAVVVRLLISHFLLQKYWRNFIFERYLRLPYKNKLIRFSSSLSCGSIICSKMKVYLWVTWMNWHYACDMSQISHKKKHKRIFTHNIKIEIFSPPCVLAVCFRIQERKQRFLFWFFPLLLDSTPNIWL